MNYLRFICAAILLVTGCEAKTLTTGESMKQSNREKTIALLNSIENGEQEPIRTINPDKYIQHNLMVGDGLEGFGELMKQLPEGGAKVNVVRAWEHSKKIGCSNV